MSKEENVNPFLTYPTKKDDIEVKVRKIHPLAKLPTKGTGGAAGYDLYACCDKKMIIFPGANKMIGTGLAMEIPKGYWGGIYARSGLAFKRHLRPANCTAVIDEDYRGEVKVAVHNDGWLPKIVKPGERIAQMVYHIKTSANHIVVDELSETERGGGGFGSTGAK